MQVAIGIDTHKGVLPRQRSTPSAGCWMSARFTNALVHRSLLRWVTEQAQPRRIRIEGSLSYGSAAARMLLGHAEDVQEVAACSHIKSGVGGPGKSDPVDAVAIA